MSFCPMVYPWVTDACPAIYERSGLLPVSLYFCKRLCGLSRMVLHNRALVYQPRNSLIERTRHGTMTECLGNLAPREWLGLQERQNSGLQV